MQPESAMDLATLHWEYVKKTLKKHGVEDKVLGIAEYHYKTAFVHGFKHGAEYESTEEKEPAIGFERQSETEEDDEEDTDSGVSRTR